MENSLSKPTVIVIGGPNGAGKSTLARTLLPSGFEFINADEIAKSLQAERADRPVNVDVAAGKLALQRMDQLAVEKRSFAVETTLSSRKLATRIQRLQTDRYQFKLYYVWVKSPDLSVNRVEDRVRMGGHNIPEDVIRRRYDRGLQNFFETYSRIANAWFVYDNNVLGRVHIVAERDGTAEQVVHDLKVWQTLNLQLEEIRQMEKSISDSTHVADAPLDPKYTYKAPSPEARRVEALFRLAVRQAMIEHKAAGMPMVVWRDDKVVWIPADELVIEDG
jgi:predicted ABC-type ATPase